MTYPMSLYTTLLDRCKIDPADGKPVALDGINPSLTDKALARSLTEAFPRAVPYDFGPFAALVDTNTRGDALAELPVTLPQREFMYVEFTVNGDGAKSETGVLFATHSDPERPGYLTAFYVFTSYQNLIGPLARGAARFDEYGVIRNDSGVPDVVWRIEKPFTETPDNMQTTAYIVTVAFLGSALTHCVNVAERHSRLPRPESRAREKAGKEPIVYKQLVFEPLARPTTAREFNDSLDTRQQKRLQSVAGHFRVTKGGHAWIAPAPGSHDDDRARLAKSGLVTARG